MPTPPKAARQSIRPILSTIAVLTASFRRNTLPQRSTKATGQMGTL